MFGFRNPYAEMVGYEEKTTFWSDFSIADRFGVSAVKDTFNRAFNEWKTNTVYITELCMVMNWKSWQHCDTNEALSKVYVQLWEKVDSYCLNNLKGDDLSYFFRTTD